MTSLDKYADEVLKAYHEMMDECVVKVEKFAPLAVSLWSEVLKELDKRKLVQLNHGSYDDITNALITRLWKE